MFRAILSGLAACAMASAAVLVNPSEADAMRAVITRGDPAAAAAAQALREAADRALREGPWTVTATRPPRGGNLDPHDYYSEGPYWWPDPRNPGGPYIRRDGRTNPDRFMGHKSAMNSMSDALFVLGAAAYLFNDPRYAERANRVATVWFVDAKTRMNPNLEHGQAVPGRETGRGTGIIDTRVLIRAAQGLDLVDRAGKLDPVVHDSVRRWFAEFDRWLTTSKKGLDEKKSGNNHASWWSAQVAAYAGFTGDRALQQMAFRWMREELFPKQIQPDGSAPRELARTKSLGYSAFNFEAYAVACRIAQAAGVNLWDLRTPQGATLGTIADYLLPALREPKQWKGEQIIEFDNSGMYYLALAGRGLSKPEYIRAYRDLEHPGDAWLAFIDLWLAATQ